MTRSTNRYYVINRLWLLLMIITHTSFAQEDLLITEKFDNISFSDVVTIIESKSEYHFYFDEKSMDSVRITQEFNQEKLASVLYKIFKDSDYHYAINNQQVFITKGREIRTELPINYFNATILANENYYDVALIDFLEDDNNQGLTKKLEIHEIGIPSKKIKDGKAKISGKISNLLNGEYVIGAVVYQEESGIGAATDALGNYTINIPTGRTQLKVSSIGMEEITLEILLYSDGVLDIEMKEQVTALKEVVIVAERGANLTQTQMGLEKINMKAMKQVPTVLGEVDVMRVVLTLPGVQSTGENTTGLNVRGGSTGQNLILFNDATIYNPSHLFGFFSVFNPEVVKDVQLYKSGIPAHYGGRLSSVLEVESKEGNRKKFSVSGGISPITGRLLVEGPIIKDKLSFLVSGRSTYSDWILSMIPNEDVQNSSGSFYDLHASITYDKNENNRLSLSSYYSDDKFRFGNDTVYQYNNFNTTVKWKTIFNKKFYGEFEGGVSQYKYNISSDGIPAYAFNSDYKINQFNIQADLNYIHKKHSFSFGGSSIYYQLSPVSLSPLGNESIIVNDLIPEEQGLESAIYFGDQIEIGDKLSIYGALRFSFYQFLGPGTVHEYDPQLPKEDDTIIKTTIYDSNEIIKSYKGPELRLSARYKIHENSSLKLSFHRMRQYIHMLSNTISISPTDTWKLSDSHIKPEIGDQISLGIYQNLNSNAIETSVEAYYKTMKNFLDYKDGAQLFLNRNIERDIIGTDGIAYGIEVMVKKVTGKFNGWVSYTYSRSLLKTKATEGVESINQGEYYPSSYDKPHDVTVVSNYKVSRRFSVSFNLTYSTGRPITLPLGKYSLKQSERLYYSERNEFRIPNYFRLDFSMNLEGNHRIKKLAHSSWSLSVYNLTGRDNAYSVFYRAENGQINGYLLSIFGSAIPTITYNFKF